MTTVVAVLAGVIGLAVGPTLADVARRSLDETSPPLLTGSDIGVITRFGGPSRSTRDRIVQLVTAALAVGVALTIGARFSLPAYLGFVAVTVVLTVTDIDHKLIPNRITLPGGVAGGLLLVGGVLLDGDAERILWALIGALGYFVFMLILALAVPGGLGFGDVKLALILGGFVAAEHLGYVMIAAIGAYVIGGAISAILLITRVKSRKDTIPFGPYMVVAAYVAILAGDAIVRWYLN